MSVTLALFAGIGATAYGQRTLGQQVIAVERDATACATIRTNQPDVTVVEADVKTLDWSLFRGVVTRIAGGAPCQPFSQGGAQAGQWDPRDCIPDFCAAVEVIQPETFLLEEVWTLTWKKNALYFAAVIARLERAGYSVEYRVLVASDYGIPQARKRLFVQGVRRDIAETRGYGVRWAEKHATAPITLATALGWDAAEADRRALQAPVYGDPSWVFNRPSTTVVGSFRPEIQAAPGYRKAGDGPRQNTPGSVALTIREAMTLQGIPADWQVWGTTAQQWLQVGNSCPPAWTAELTAANA